MTTGWLRAPLGDLIIENPKSPIKVRDSVANGRYPFYTSGTSIRSSEQFLCDGPNLFVATGGKACIQYFDGKAAYSTDCYSLTTRAKLLPKYLFYFLSSMLRDIDAGMFEGAALRHLQKPQFKSISVPLPVESEQARLVEILDQALAAIATVTANVEANIESASSLFESELQAVFSKRHVEWTERRLGDLFSVGSSKRIHESEWTSSGVPFYGGKEIVRLAKWGATSSNAYIPEKLFHEYAAKYDMPQPGDILITARGTIGVGYVVKEGDQFYYKDGNIISLREKVRTDPRFILYALKSQPLTEQFADLSGTTVRHLPIERAKKLVLQVPGYAEQKKVVEHLRDVEDETHRLAHLYEQKLLALEELRQSLFHKAFTRQL